MTCACKNLSVAVLLSVTNAARKTQTQLWKTQTRPRKIHKRSCTAFRKPMCVRTQRSSEEAFRFFGRNLRFSEEAFRFAEEAFQFAARAAPQTHFGKAFLNISVIFFDTYRMSLTNDVDAHKMVPVLMGTFCLLLHRCENKEMRDKPRPKSHTCVHTSMASKN